MSDPAQDVQLLLFQKITGSNGQDYLEECSWDLQRALRRFDSANSERYNDVASASPRGQRAGELSA